MFFLSWTFSGFCSLWAQQSPPEVTLSAPAEINAESAWVSGTVNPHGATTMVTFEYGTSTAYGASVPYVLPNPEATTPQDVLGFLENLLPNAVCHYRLKATNAGGTTYSADAIVTPKPPPSSSPYVQQIIFNAPPFLYVGELGSSNPRHLTAFATSGLPVKFLTVSGPGYVNREGELSLSGPGILKVMAVEWGNDLYKPATPVLRSIEIRAAPTRLTLTNLYQKYDGHPKPVGVMGTEETVTVLYYRDGNFHPIPPRKAGSYVVRATAPGSPMVTGTLVITKAPLYVTANDQNKVAGTPNPELTFGCYGFLAGDDMDSLLSPPVVKTTATRSSPGGVYPIVMVEGFAENYYLIRRRGTMTVTTYAGTYDGLMEDPAASPWGGIIAPSGSPVGKFTFSIPATNTTFTATMRLSSQSVPMTLAGRLDITSDPELGTWISQVRSNGKTYWVMIAVDAWGNCALGLNLNGQPLASSTTGKKRLYVRPGSLLPYRGNHTMVLSPPTPADAGAPPSSGWATANIGATGVLTLAGELADGARFTTSIPASRSDSHLDSDYMVYVQPYTGRLNSYLAGEISLHEHPDLPSRRYIGSDYEALLWVKAGRAGDAGYRSGFDPVTLVLTMDPWRAPVKATAKAPATTLAQLLGLVSDNLMLVHHADTGSEWNSNMASVIGLSSTNLVSVQAPILIPDLDPGWKMTINPVSGSYQGSFRLKDGDLLRTVLFNGVLRQLPAAAPFSTSIGAGHYLLPSLPAGASIGRTSGEMKFTR